MTVQHVRSCFVDRQRYVPDVTCSSVPVCVRGRAVVGVGWVHQDVTDTLSGRRSAGWVQRYQRAVQMTQVLDAAHTRARAPHAHTHAHILHKGLITRECSFMAENSRVMSLFATQNVFRSSRCARLHSFTKANAHTHMLT